MTVIALKTVGSTNDYAKDMARAGAVSGTIVTAEEQTAGRGRQGNAWLSLQGNLFMSMIVRPARPLVDFGQLSFLAGLALVHAVDDDVPDADVRLKWPNDLFINGRKAAGILIETEGSGWAVMGVGVNVAVAPEGAVALADIGVRLDVLMLRDRIAANVMTLLSAWETGGFSALRDAWLARAYKLGEEIKARLPQETISGVFEGIDATGALQLRRGDGSLRLINAGEVFV